MYLLLLWILYQNLPEYQNVLCYFLFLCPYVCNIHGIPLRIWNWVQGRELNITNIFLFRFSLTNTLGAFFSPLLVTKISTKEEKKIMFFSFFFLFFLLSFLMFSWGKFYSNLSNKLLRFLCEYLKQNQRILLSKFILCIRSKSLDIKEWQ